MAEANDMAYHFDQSQLPTEIACEVVPSTLYDELPLQKDRITPRTSGSGHPIIPPVESGSDAATYKLRGSVIASHYGVLPDGYHNVITGDVDSPASNQSNDAIYKRLKDDIFKERFGPSTFIQRYIRGKFSTEHCRVLLANWAIDARRCDFPLPDEDEEGPAVGAANKIVFNDCIRMLEQIWTNSYEQAICNATARIDQVRGFEQVRLYRLLKRLRELKDAPPRSQLYVNTLQSMAACNQAKESHPLFRPEDQRLLFWLDDFNCDMLASHLEASRLVVDFRRLVEEEEPTVPGQELIPPYLTMKKNHWAFSCDILCRMVISVQMYSHHLTRFSDPRYREAASVTGWSDLSHQAYRCIRSLHDEHFSTAAHGSWEGVPIISQQLTGIKRQRRGNIGGGHARQMIIRRRII